MTQSPRAKRKAKQLALLPRAFALSDNDQEELAAYAKRNLGKALEGLDESIVNARHLFKTNPAIYTLCYQALLSGQPPYVVVERYGAHYDAICQIRRIYPEVVLAGRKQIVHNLEQVSLSLSNRLALEGNQIAIDKVAGTLATVVEKLQLLTGGVTSRSEHLNAPKPEEIQAMFESLPKAKAEVITE